MVYRAAHKNEIRAKHAAYNAAHKAEEYAARTGCDVNESKLWHGKPDRDCWLCGEPGATHLDHEHTTNRIRGWAHAACNKAEGLIATSPDPRCLLATLALAYK